MAAARVRQFRRNFGAGTTKINCHPEGSGPAGAGGSCGLAQLATGDQWPALSQSRETTRFLTALRGKRSRANRFVQNDRN